MKFLSVCSGIEAASVAWAPLGWSAVAFSEIEPFPCAVLAHHYPDVPNFGDMTKFKEWPDVAIDLLCGGTPCQSFSVAGLRKGLDDPRGNLMLTFGAIAARYRPRWLVWENVPGVLSSNGGRDFGAFLGMLGQLGYGFAYRVLDAQYAGLAQRRKRVFVVGCLGDWRRAAAVLFERHSLSGHPAPSRKTWQRAAGTIAASSFLGGAGGRPEGAAAGHFIHCADIAPTLNAAFGSKLGLEDQHIRGGVASSLPATSQCITTGTGQRYDPETETLIPTIGGGFDVAHALTGEGFDASEDGTGRGTPLIPIDMRQASRGATMTNNRAEGSSGGAPGTGIGEDGDPSPTISTSHTPAIAFSAKDHGADASEDLAPTLRAGGHANSHANAGVMPAVAFSITPSNSNSNKDYNAREVDKAQALTAGGNRPSARGGDLIAGMQVRRLTPSECLALQGFARDYLDITYRGKPAADGPKYKATGNSWAVPVVRWIGERIDAVESISRELEAA